MRESGGSYIYDLRVPNAAPNALFTVRIQPSVSTAVLSVVLRIRK